MEREIQKMVDVGKKAENAERLKKVDIKNYKSAVNDAIRVCWEKEVQGLCLSLGTESHPFIKEIYWFNTPQAHTIEKSSEKLTKLFDKLCNDDQYKVLLDKTISIVNKFIPMAKKVKQFQERLDNQEVIDKAPKDPASNLPPASRAALLQVKGLLEEKSQGLKKELLTNYKSLLTSLLDDYLALPYEERCKPLEKVYKHKREIIPLLRPMTSLNYNIKNKERTKSDKAEEFINKFSEDQSTQVIEQYVYKHTVKLGGIFEKMPNLKTVELDASYQRGSIEGSLKLNFEDDRAFTVRSQVVYGMSPNGVLFSKYPTTFHDVINSDGSIEGKMLSESEMHNWAQGNNNELNC